jgi:uncharacterized protein
VIGELLLDKSGDTVVVTGSLEFAATLACSRCLRRFSQGYRTAIDLCYRPAAAPRPARGHETELTAGDLVEIGYRQGEIDLWPELRDAVLLALPVKPLCGDDCRGLCPSCGRDLNQGQCGCRDDRTDPRWDKLRKLAGT